MFVYVRKSISEIIFFLTFEHIKHIATLGFSKLASYFEILQFMKTTLFLNLDVLSITN